MPLRGQTLIGLMVSLTLSSFLLLTVIAFYHHSQRQNREILLHLRLQTELQRVVQLIGKDLRRAGFRAVSDAVQVNNLPLFEDERGGSINVFQADNESANSCVLFFYDLDMNGCIGSKFKGGICAVNDQNATQEIERELFGYRLNNQMAETRLTYKNAVKQNCRREECRRYLQQFACNGGGWVDLLDEKEYAVSRLSFNRLAGKNGIEVQLAGYLVRHHAIHYETSIVVPLLNNGGVP